MKEIKDKGANTTEMDNKVMERVTTRQAANELNMDVEALQYLMRHDRLPIGHVLKKDGATRHTYYIYRGLLDVYKRQIEGKIRQQGEQEG